MKTNRLLYPLAFTTALYTALAGNVFAAQQLNTSTHEFSIKLGATRVIYHAGSAGADIAVQNEQAYPVLIQSFALDETKKASSAFVVTPPLLRLEAGQQSRLRIIYTGASMAPDRETLNWLCVKGVPPVASSDKKQPGGAGLEVTLSVSTCDKMFYRPDSLKGTPVDVAGSLTWTRAGKKVTVSNPTGFFMNMASVTVGGMKVNQPDYVPPFGSRIYTLPADARGEINWRIITDNGGDSRAFRAELS